MSSIKYDRVVKYKLSGKTDSPLHIGSSFGDPEEVLTDPDSGLPFIQASSLAGMLRSISTNLFDCELTTLIFGNNKDNFAEDSNHASRVKVTDGVMDPSSVRLETRPNISIDRKTGTVSSETNSGQKYDITYISPDARFSFYVYLFIQSDKQSDLVDKLQTIFGTFRDGHIGLGAKKSSGAGKFIIESIKSASYDLRNNDQRYAWANEEDDTDLRDITGKCFSSESPVKYNITVKANTDGPIQIKSIAMSRFGENVPDSENIMDGRENYIIPGTSIRGTIRSQMEKIASYQDKSSIINSAFGFAGNEYSEGHCGNLIFNDCIIGKREDIDINPIRNRIHIDKFTGGVMNQAFFKEKNASGKVDIMVQILNKQNPEASLGLLLYALRDLAVKTINLGNGYATGKGFLNVSEINIKSDDLCATLLFENGSITDDDKIIENALRALKEVSE